MILEEGRPTWWGEVGCGRSRKPLDFSQEEYDLLDVSWIVQV